MLLKIDFVVYFVEMFVCGADVVFGKEEYVVCMSRALCVPKRFLKVHKCLLNWGNLVSGKGTCISIW